MTALTTANAIRTRFRTNVTDVYSYSTAWDNMPFSPPSGALWLQFSVLHGDSDQVEVGGGGRFRTNGVAFANVFAPVDTGDAAATQAADRIVAEFRAVTAGGVTYRTPSVRRVGRSGNWFQINVEIPWYADVVPA